MINFILKLFNLDNVDMTGAEGWHIRFVNEWAPPVVFGIVALVAFLTWFIYKREKGTASKPYKHMLMALRLLSFAILIIILLGPAIVVTKSEMKESYVVVLADKSDSMNIADKYRDEKLAASLAYAAGLIDKPAERLSPELTDQLRALTRAEIANKILANPRLKLAEQISATARVKQYVFSSGISAAELVSDPAQPAKLRPLVIQPDGPVTQIGESIRDVLAELRGQRVAAMIVISDWDSNSGLNPVEAAGKCPFPIFAVGSGDPAEQRDLIVQNVLANPVAFIKDPLVFDVTVEQAGYDKESIDIELVLDGNVVSRKSVKLGGVRSHHTLTHTPTALGEFKYIVRIPGRDEELSNANNSMEHQVIVKDDKIRVLLVSAMPSWEWRYLKSALARDASVEVSTWLQSADRNWVMAGGTQINSFPLNKKELLDAYDVIIMLGASPDGFAEEQLENIRSFVGDFGGGLIFSPGPMVANETFENSPIGKCLPVSLISSGALSADPSPAKLRITAEGWTHPLMTLLENDQENRDLWESLPGFYWFYPTGKPKPGAYILAEHPDIKTEFGNLPVIVEQRYGTGKVLYVGTDETWRWRYITQDKYFYKFWRQSMGVIATSKLLGNAKRLTLSLSRNRCNIGQKVDVEVKMLDDMLRPSEEQFVNAMVDIPGGMSQELRLAKGDDGLYRGSLVARKLGEHKVWIKAGANDKPESAQLIVSMSTLESESRRLNTEAMQAVAGRTFGKAFTIDQFDKVPALIKSEAVNFTSEHPTEIWDSWGMLILFAIPITLEWWFRKRRQLL